MTTLRRVCVWRAHLLLNQAYRRLRASGTGWSHRQRVGTKAMSHLLGLKLCRSFELWGLAAREHRRLRIIYLSCARRLMMTAWARAWATWRETAAQLANQELLLRRAVAYLRDAARIRAFEQWYEFAGPRSCDTPKPDPGPN